MSRRFVLRTYLTWTFHGVVVSAALAACGSDSTPEATADSGAASSTSSGGSSGASSSGGGSSGATSSGGSSSGAAMDAGDAAKDAPPFDGAVACTRLASPSCNAVTMPAAATFVTSEIGAPPTVNGGGTVPDGIYVLVREVRESGSGSTQKIAFVQAGTCLASYVIPQSGAEIRASADVTYANGEMSGNAVCPFVGVVPATPYRVDTLVSGKAKFVTLAGTTPNRVYREYQEQ